MVCLLGNREIIDCLRYVSKDNLGCRFLLLFVLIEIDIKSPWVSLSIKSITIKGGLLAIEISITTNAPHVLYTKMSVY